MSRLLLFAFALSFAAASAHADPGPGDPPEITKSSGTIHVVIPPDWAPPAK